MSRANRPHLPVRPVWLCRACGHPWPCGAARLSLLVEYRDNRPGLLIYLATLREEATAQLAQLTPAEPPGDLTDRFITWARARS